MPVYAYRCPSCNYDWDERRELGDHAVLCPLCGKLARHVFAAVKFKFGTGPHRRREAQSHEGDGEVYTRTYEPGETVGDPMLDEGFRRAE